LGDEKQERAASRNKSQEADGVHGLTWTTQVGRFWFKVSLPWLSPGRRVFYEERKRMKKTLAGSFMALLLVAFLTACAAGAGGGGGGGGGVGGAGKGPAPVDLKTAGNYVILASTAITDSSTSVITGDIGISPNKAGSITGFTPAPVVDAGGAFSIAGEVTGKIYASDYAVPTPANLISAVNAMGTAYNDAAGRIKPDFLQLGSGEIGGLTLVPGLYNWTNSVTISNNVTLSGGADDTWIFQIAGTLTSAASKNVILTGGAQAKNIIWVVAGGATLGATSQFSGIILSKTQITTGTGSSVTGRLLAQAAVTVNKSTVKQP
jgi:hypothetical protein